MLCNIGNGCSIYEYRPKACKDFVCGWLVDETLADDLRPDRVHLYPSGKLSDECIKIIVDPEHEDDWKMGKGAEVVNHFLNQGIHVLVVIDKQINFIKAHGKEQPDKLLVDWLL